MTTIQTAWARRAAAVAVAVLALAGAGGCRRKPATAPPVSGPRTEDMSWGPVQLTFTIDPSRVDLSRDVMLTLRLSAPQDMDVRIPPIHDRLQGFTQAGSYDQEPYVKDGKSIRETHYRLTPMLADTYRIAPMAVEYTDRAVSPPQTGWFPTRPVVLERMPLGNGRPGKDVQVSLTPLWIHPSFKTIMLYVGLGILLLAAGFLAWRLTRRVREEIRLMRMSPRERALHELAALLARDLVGHNRVKDFYVELTMIVRRYIERQHAIRAPEQTTEEFLDAVSRDSRFIAVVVAKLKAFLTAADLVKFAAYQPDRSAIDKATATAREYVETDTAAMTMANAMVEKQKLRDEGIRSILGH